MKGGLLMGQRRKGFEVAPNQALFTNRAQDGQWSAWLEDDEPSSPCNETVKLFVGDSAFQAQIKAIRWLRQSEKLDPDDPT
jgi:hypothetical protein